MMLVSQGKDFNLSLPNELYDLIHKMPTYDLDKVIEQLDKASDYYECSEQGREYVQMIDLSEAIEIVESVFGQH